jgi:glutaredoxin
VLKAYLSERGIDFVDHDVTVDPEGLRELVETYQSRSTPTIVIGDEVMIGFDPERLDQLLSQ